MKENNGKSFYVNFLCTIGVLATFAIAALVLANVGVRVYKNIVVENADNYKLRTSLSYVATKVRQNEDADCIYIEKREGVDVLVMEERGEGVTYETLIYYYKGKLYEVLHEKGGEFTIDNSTGYGYEIMEINNFSMEMLGESMIRFKAENGKGDTDSIILNLRTRG